jgi:hypothetical protein
VWQSFDIARELERVHGRPWATELSPMTGGSLPAPFLQEFPAAQYAALFLRKTAALSIPNAGQAVAAAIGAAALLAWLGFALLLPLSPAGCMLTGSLIFFVPAFLRYGATAVPDALVFLLNLSAASLILTGRRVRRGRLIVLGAVLAGLAVLAKATALIAAVVLVAALLLDRRWRAALALVLAALPGVVWAAAASIINKGALPVNYFARIAAIPEYWWNPRLYYDPWWARNLGFTIYDVLGPLGLAACLWIVVTARRRHGCAFETILMIGPSALTILLFNYHAASHAYYSLVWLPFTMTGAVELALRTPAPGWSRTAVAGCIACLGLLGIAERQFGAVERFLARQPEAVKPILDFETPQANARDESARHAIVETAKRATLVAYLGGATSPFLESGIRGWAVEAPSEDQAMVERRKHLPESVLRQEDWRQLDEAWFRDRIRRGLGAVLVERGGTLDNPKVLGWAQDAGLREAGDPPGGHRLLLPGR